MLMFERLRDFAPPRLSNEIAKYFDYCSKANMTLFKQYFKYARVVNWNEASQVISI